MVSARFLLRAARIALAALIAIACIGCGETEPTEVVVVVTGDFAVPDALDRVLIVVTPPEGPPQTAEADLTTGPLPRTLGIYNPDGPLGPYLVEAVGQRGGVNVVRRRARFNFVRDTSLEVELPLLVECSGVTCLCNDTFCSTCGEGGVCENASIKASAFDGTGGETEADAGVDL
ncbi:MAG: hypothetical protein H5U40_08665 [Polyangiaceae bacterium]|nr:hypothetical protein [Polyangiaceae bacterium]